MGQERLAKAVIDYLSARTGNAVKPQGEFEIQLEEPYADYIHVYRKGSTWLTLALYSSGVWRVCYAQEAAAKATALRLDMESYAAHVFETNIQTKG